MRVIATFMVFLAATLCQAAGAERLVKAVLPPGGKFTYLERSDLRRYENGKFVGLEHREVRGILQQRTSDLAAVIEGTFYVLQALDHGGAETAQEVAQAIPVTYSIQPDGTYAIEGDGSYPALRGFPIAPTDAMSVGDQWTGPGTRLVEPLHDGRFSRTRFIADYRYDGEVTQGSKTVKIITATYAARYKKGDDPAGDIRLLSVTGVPLPVAVGT